MTIKEVLKDNRILIDKQDYKFLLGYSWSVNSNGYLRRNPKLRNGEYENIECYFHRLVLGAKKGFIVDHINRNRLDNRRENLRIVSFNQSILNRNTKLNKSTGIRGVRKVGNKFRAYMSFQGKQIHLGYYFTLEEAKLKHKEFYEQSFN